MMIVTALNYFQNIRQRPFHVYELRYEILCEIIGTEKHRNFESKLLPIFYSPFFGILRVRCGGFYL